MPLSAVGVCRAGLGSRATPPAASRLAGWALHARAKAVSHCTACTACRPQCFRVLPTTSRPLPATCRSAVKCWRMLGTIWRMDSAKWAVISGAMLQAGGRAGGCMVVGAISKWRAGWDRNCLPLHFVSSRHTQRLHRWEDAAACSFTGQEGDPGRQAASMQPPTPEHKHICNDFGAPHQQLHRRRARSLGPCDACRRAAAVGDGCQSSAGVGGAKPTPFHSSGSSSMHASAAIGACFSCIPTWQGDVVAEAGQPHQQQRH